MSLSGSFERDRRKAEEKSDQEKAPAAKKKATSKSEQWRFAGQYIKMDENPLTCKW
jgi:hypothetical protein